MANSSTETKARAKQRDRRVRWKPITKTEAHCAAMEAGFHVHYFSTGETVYGGGPGWSEGDYDEASDRLASWLLNRLSDSTATQEPGND